jgi:hypothetical protein
MWQHQTESNKIASTALLFLEELKRKKMGNKMAFYILFTPFQ